MSREYKTIKEYSATELDKMSVSEWLDKLTDENWHNERLIIEAIADGRPHIMEKAIMIWQMHQIYGHMPMELVELRNQLYKEMDEE